MEVYITLPRSVRPPRGGKGQYLKRTSGASREAELVRIASVVPIASIVPMQSMHANDAIDATDAVPSVASSAAKTDRLNLLSTKALPQFGENLVFAIAFEFVQHRRLQHPNDKEASL